jgi:hypothetical protein
MTEVTVLVWHKNPAPPVIHVDGDCPTLSRSNVPDRLEPYSGPRSAGWMRLSDAIRLPGAKKCDRCM